MAIIVDITETKRETDKINIALLLNEISFEDAIKRYINVFSKIDSCNKLLAFQVILDDFVYLYKDLSLANITEID